MKPRVLYGVDPAGPDDSQTVSIGMVRCKVCDSPIYYDPLRIPPEEVNAICEQPPYNCKRWAEEHYALALLRHGFPKWP